MILKYSRHLRRSAAFHGQNNDPQRRIVCPLLSSMKNTNVAFAVTALAGVAAVHKIWSWVNRSRRMRRLAKHKKVALLPNEVAPMICKAPSISTITFFEGDVDAAKTFLLQRTKEIIAANPWLDGILDLDDNDDMALFVPPAEAGQKKHFEVLNTSLSDNYDEMVQQLAPAMCGTTEETVGTDKVLWKVTLVVSEGTKFAVVVSANHSFLDGHGYYKFYNMLSGTEAVKSFSPQRKHNMPQKILAAMGGEKSLMAAAPPGFLLRFIGGVLRNTLFPATKSLGFHISSEWLKAQKAMHSSDVPFVSTNDVVMSNFCNALKCNLAFMNINFRSNNRIEGCLESDVGNYEDLLLYTPSDYATPSLIRKSLNGPLFRRVGGGKLPTNLEHLSSTYGAVTNWATFARQVYIPGANQVLHIPLFDFPQSTPACILGAMCIFKPKDGGVAALIAGKEELIDTIKRTGMVGRQLGNISF